MSEALQAGEIGSGHVDAIASGVKMLGGEVIATFEDIVLEVARSCDADAVRQTIRTIRDTLDPDAADAAYLHALDKRDLTLTRVGEGFAVGGFLDPETGVMFQQVLYSAAKPTDKDDLRAPGERRVDGLRDVCRSLLDHGLPSDRGVRPQVFVTVTADRLAGKEYSAVPAVPTGFGQISDLLLAKLACDCAVTPVLVDGSGPYPHVLDVGRTSRLATLKQRQAILTQQGGRCFAPGCANTHLEIHHLLPWAQGGRTDMADQRGYCTRCHHLIHLRQLVVTPDGQGGWTHQTRRGRLLTDHHRTTSRLTHRYLHALMEGGAAYARAELHQWRQGAHRPRAPIPRPAVDWPPDDRPVMNRPPDDRPVMNRPPDDRPVVNRPPDDRPVMNRPPDSRFAVPRSKQVIPDSGVP